MLRPRRPAILLCLLAALSGTPLRQAEAASDLSRILGAAEEEALGTPDGGVGDDVELATLHDGPVVAQDDPALLPLPHLLPLVNAEACPDNGPVGRPPSPPAARRAWL